MVSIIIPIYNAEHYLVRCLESVINQTYSNIEIILVNDGSKDNSENLCLRYANKDKRICYIYQENKGAGAARYCGVQNATGEFLFFVDSDDYLATDAIEIFMNEIESGIDCVIGQHSRFGNSQSIKQVKFPVGIFDFTGDKTNKTYINEIINDLHGSELWNKLIRAEILKKAWRYPITVQFGEDTLYLVRIFFNCSKIKCIADITYYYEFRENSLARSTNRLMILPQFAQECVKLEEMVLEQRAVWPEYSLIVYHILSIALVKYVGDSFLTRNKVISDIEDIAGMNEIQDYARHFLSHKRKFKKRYELDEMHYCQAITLYKSIIHKDAWYYTILYPAMIEKEHSWFFVLKAYINKVRRRVKK